MKTALPDLLVRIAHTTPHAYVPAAHPEVSVPLQTTAETPIES
jgi:hypothetical protein